MVIVVGGVVGRNNSYWSVVIVVILKGLVYLVTVKQFSS